MNISSRTTAWGAVCFLLGVGWAYLPLNFAGGEASIPRAPFHMRDRLGSNLYMQLSAEYRAVCLQTYRTAEDRLQVLLRTRPARPAVIMDLDETVFDNSAFQSFLYENDLQYSDELWAHYEEKYPDEVRLVPGAKAFIMKAAAEGVYVVFVSNRLEDFRPSTEAALKRLGLPHDRIVLKTTTSDKTARRDAVGTKYNVLMIIGDNLRDFAETFVAPKLPANGPADSFREAHERRAVVVDEAECHWGVDWFILPNPCYGEWDKLTSGDPLGILRPSNMDRPAATAARSTP